MNAGGADASDRLALVTGAASTIPLGRGLRNRRRSPSGWRLAGESSAYMTGERRVISGGSVMR
jgi:hypothetical protein